MLALLVLVFLAIHEIIACAGPFFAFNSVLTHDKILFLKVRK